MMKCSTLAIALAGGLLIGAPARAQSLADAAAEAAKIKHDWPTSTNTGPAPVPLTPEDLVIDRSKFDKAYAAGKAVAEAQYFSAVGVTPRQFQQLLLAFDTENSIAMDKATTKAEKVLVGKYQLASLQFALAGAQHDSRTAWPESMETMKKATATLDAANKIYLGKKE